MDNINLMPPNPLTEFFSQVLNKFNFLAQGWRRGIETLQQAVK